MVSAWSLPAQLSNPVLIVIPAKAGIQTLDHPVKAG
jgi:hypothetical protein